MPLNLNDIFTYSTVLEVCIRYEIDIVYREYFNKLLAEYENSGITQELSIWLNDEIPLRFLANGERPRWIQAPEWLFDKHFEPMIFLGQIDLEKETYGIFHDDASIYIFISKIGEVKTIVQTY
jgi:hypothetical protein